jgi:hypothetical protein
MKRRIVNLLLGVSMMALSGCIFLPVPHEEWLSPRFSGTVVDAESDRPLDGVKITLSSYRHAEAEVGAIVGHSDAAGRYSILASRHSIWTPIWLGPAEGIQGGIVRFERDGYVVAEVKKEVFTGAMSRTQFEVNVRLKKKGPNQTPEPTPPSVTDRADARSAPAGVVAHL